MPNKVKLAAPWTTCYRKFQAFFKKDPQVKVLYDEYGPTIRLLVDDNPFKADALTKVLPTKIDFGNVTLKIVVVPNNNPNEIAPAKIEYPEDPIVVALNGNPCLVKAQLVETTGFRRLYLCFAKEVVQFFNDNLGDLRGMTSTLYQDIAEEIFPEHNGVSFCTISDDSTKFGAPLGEWP